MGMRIRLKHKLGNTWPELRTYLETAFYRQFTPLVFVLFLFLRFSKLLEDSRKYFELFPRKVNKAKTKKQQLVEVTAGSKVRNNWRTLYLSIFGFNVHFRRKIPGNWYNVKHNQTKKC